MATEKINFKPTAGYIITTCYLEKEDFKFSLGEPQPKIKQIQKVVAVGERANVQVGDWIMVDHANFTKHVKVKSTIRAGIGGEDMIKEEFVPPFIAVPGYNEPLLKVSYSEIEGTILEYEKLPKEIKEYMTMVEYEKGKEKAAAEFTKAKNKFDANKAKNTKDNSSRKGPMIITETTKTR